MSNDNMPAADRGSECNDLLGLLAKPAGFSAGTDDGALFTLKRSTGKNFAKGAMQPLCEWYSADQMRAAFAAGQISERNRCRYPDCLENKDERCSRWLSGECAGPKAQRPSSGGPNGCTAWRSEVTGEAVGPRLQRLVRLGADATEGKT
jgi:hypothetical protein